MGAIARICLAALVALPATASLATDGHDRKAVRAPTTQPLGVLEIRAGFGHDALAGSSLRRGRSWGAAVDVVVMARPERLRAGHLFERFSLGLGAELGWQARVPTDSVATKPQPFDVAPTGYLYGGLRAQLLHDMDRLTLRYTIGAFGAFGAFGDHSNANLLYDTLGTLGSWADAAEGEIVQNVWIRWEHHWFSTMPAADGRHLVDLTSEATTALGELRISQTCALAIRIGRLEGPLPGTTRSLAEQGFGDFEAYVFARVGFDLVARDGFIDGPIFNDDPHPYTVSASPFVPHGTIGGVLGGGRGLRVGYAFEVRGQEVQVSSGSSEPAPPHT